MGAAVRPHIPHIKKGFLLAYGPQATTGSLGFLIISL